MHPSITFGLRTPLYCYRLLKMANARRCWAADQHLLRSYSYFECNRDLKLSRIGFQEFGSLVLWQPYNWPSRLLLGRHGEAQHPLHGLVVA